MPGFGAEFKHALRKPSTWMFMMAGFGEVLPYRENRVLLDEKLTDRFGIPQVRFDVEFRENEERMMKDIVKQSVDMLSAAKMRPIPMGKANVPGGAIHEMGGARMGSDPRESVLNAHNQAHDIPNLFVTDGACMTSGSCVNPSLTFMALTARAADYAVTQLKAGNI